MSLCTHVYMSVWMYCLLQNANIMKWIIVMANISMKIMSWLRAIWGNWEPTVQKRMHNNMYGIPILTIFSVLIYILWAMWNMCAKCAQIYYGLTCMSSTMWIHCQTECLHHGQPMQYMVKLCSNIVKCKWILSILIIYIE